MTVLSTQKPIVAPSTRRSGVVSSITTNGRAEESEATSRLAPHVASSSPAPLPTAASSRLSARS